ncbi:hypothetical protein METBIDRAFT_47072 [Metschnikowia bicuspidata var. bicuspidata NRRL YB-4993]|uniref:Transcription activator GCR1-like domain-containing protein n=1 Tax=Metschnikowia bicuspidata var. bicuspidata NRRL YB-4993 TaxID=869754 RepID=A0A1A0H5E9_9ASCO|nr:hypothetical protein METBIDRAFT_47072 [Metschnikowia bicuspidata var. bicuspidata NRRL YB-4993]OBA19148.1 hypothetical protein METBIDRAFT_47072 [Metschnikowia bicuspidata var. bicuspidata NRRL YB-4993]
MLPFHESQLKIADAMAKVEHEVATVNQDMAYFRHVVDFQNLKIEKLTLLLLDLLHNKDVAPIVAQLQGLQASDPFNVDDGPDAVDDALPENVHEPVHDQVVSVGSSVGVGAVLLDSNMDPQLHNVAQAAHSQHSQHSQHQGQRQQGHAQLLEHNSPRPQQDRQGAREDSDRSMSVVDMPGLEVVNINGMNGRKKPKVTVDFLHNPMTVKEIYDEFTVGFRGQPPLREMDERYGRHEWRGDSRSKESKRFQRRKKLCDAIERGMQKYGKTAEEIQAFIEDFRGDKSLTWVMNGNLPSDLLE